MKKTEKLKKKIKIALYYSQKGNSYCRRKSSAREFYAKVSGVDLFYCTHSACAPGFYSRRVAVAQMLPHQIWYSETSLQAQLVTPRVAELSQGYFL